MMDRYAPIIPKFGMGGFELNCTKKEAEKVLGRPLPEKDVYHGGTRCKYEVDNVLTLVFDEREDRLIAIETLPGYKGKLFDRIGTDTDEDELKILEPSIEYDEFEEMYILREKHMTIVTNLPERKAVWIAVCADPIV